MVIHVSKSDYEFIYKNELVYLLYKIKYKEKINGERKMYFIIGCNEEKDEMGNITIKSTIYDSEIKLTNREYIEEYLLLKKYGCKSLISELEQELNRQGILLDKKEADLIVSKLEENFNKTLILTILPTESCNFRCIYCYENHDEKFMKKEMVESIEKFLTKNYLKYNHINISWFGGEPTLCKKTVLQVNETVKKLVENDLSKYAFSMTTNGYLLDCASFIDYYNSGITMYQITIDAWKQDKNRPLKNGCATFQKIIDNLDKIHQLPKNYKFHIMIRNNILANDRDYSWYDYLNEKYGEDDRFSIVVRAVNDMGKEEVKKLNILSGEEKEKLIKEHLEYIEKLKIRCNNIEERNMFVGANQCYAAYKNGYVIRADGKIEKCTVILDCLENEIGYLDLEGNMHLDYEKNKIWNEINLFKDCYSCNKLFYCLNKSCPMQKIKEGKKECKNANSIVF